MVFSWCTLGILGDFLPINTHYIGLIYLVSGDRITPIYKPSSSAIWKGKFTPFRGLTITMVINHLLNGMILQVSSSNESLGQIRVGRMVYLTKKWISVRKKFLPNWRCLYMCIYHMSWCLCLYQYHYIKDHIYRKIICCNISCLHPTCMA